jgi:hypothetical protein
VIRLVSRDMKPLRFALVSLIFQDAETVKPDEF